MLGARFIGEWVRANEFSSYPATSSTRPTINWDLNKALFTTDCLRHGNDHSALRCCHLGSDSRLNLGRWYVDGVGMLGQRADLARPHQAKIFLWQLTSHNRYWTSESMRAYKRTEAALTPIHSWIAWPNIEFCSAAALTLWPTALASFPCTGELYAWWQQQEKLILM